MECPNCQSNKIRKNGHRRGKQNYYCARCDRQFIDRYTVRGYSIEVKENCLKMYVNGLGFRAQGVCAQVVFSATLQSFALCERVTEVNHNTVIRWVRKSALALPNALEVGEIPEITEIDEFQTFGFAKPPAEGCRNAESVCGSKKTRSSCGQQLTIGNQAF